MAFAQRIITSNSAGDQEFTFTFDYIKEEHIKVFVNFVEKTQGTGSDEFQVITNTTPKKVRLNTGLSSANTRVEIRRVSSLSTPLVDFADGSTLTATDLDTAEKQSLFIDQELDDALKQGISIDTSTGVPTLNSQRLSNVSDPVNAQDAVTKAYLERSGSITSTQILNGTIVDADINASAAIAGSKLQASSGSNAGSMSAANFTKLAGIESGATADQTNAEIRAAVEAASDSNVFTDLDHTKLNNIEANATADQTNAEIRAAVEAASDSNVFTDADHTKLNNIEANATADQTITEIKSLIAGSPLDASHLASNSVTTTQIADAELTTLAGMQSGTASKLADSTALTSDIADLNQLDGMAKETSITNSNTKFPTSAAVVNFVANQIAPVGGLEVIADEDSFPTTQPVSGVVISISNADGLVINSSGVATNARTLGNGSDNVTINNFPASLRSKTLSNNLGLLVSSTGASQIYNYHKLLAKEEDVLQLSDDINDFNNRYRVVDQNPTSDNDAGDLIFNRSTQKLLVYNSTSNAFEEAQSVGNFFISTLSPAFNGSLQDFTITNAPTNAQQIILSIGGVIQKPNSGTSTPSEGFALSGSTIKLAAAPPSGTDYFAIVLGSTVNIGTPSNNTVTSAILQSGSVIEAKLGSGAVTRTKLNLVSTSSAPGLEVKGDGSSDGYLQLNCSQNSHGIKLKSPPHSAAQSYTLTFPSSIVNNGFLKTDSSGNLSFAAVNTDLLNDTSPQLGGDLQSNGNDINFADNDKTVFGTGGDLEIYHSGNGSFIKEAGTVPLQILTNHLHVKNAANNENIFEASENSSVKLYHDNSLKFFTISGGVQAANRIIVGEGTAQRGVLSGDANSVSIGSISDIPLNFNRNSQTKARIDGNDFQIPNDNGKIELGADQDLQIYHNGTDATIDTSTGELQLASDAVMRFQATEYKFNNAANSEKIANFFQDGACELYHNHSKKFETTSSGISVTGQITATDTINTTGNLDMSDSSGTGNNRIRLGNSDDLEIYHDGSNSVVRESGTGQLQLESNTNIVLGTEGIGETYLKAVPNGAVELYHNNTKRFETQSGGAAVTGGLNVSGDTKVPDNSKFIAGTGDDLQIYHDGSNSFIKDAGTGNLFIHSSQLDILNNVASAYMLRCISGGSVELFEAGSKKFETTNVGTQVTGQIETVSTPNADPYAGFIARSSGGNNHCGFFADAATGANAQTHIRFGYSGSPKWQWRVPWHAEGASAGMMLYDYSVGDDVLKISQGGNQSIKGHVSPRSNNSYDLGTSATRWRNIYTNDLNLSNEGSSNDMDGSWGNWTIQEGESDLFLKNNRSGKKYKFNLTEVS